MRGVSAVLLALAAGFGLGLVALAVFHTTTVGNCASGPTPFNIANRCPSNDGYWTGALVVGLLVSIVAVGLIGLGVTVPAIFFTVGGACVVSLATWDVNPNWLIAAIVLPVLFFPLGAWMLSMASPRSPKAVWLLPAAGIGAAGAVWAAIAIPGPLAQPKGASAAVSATETLSDVVAAARVNRRLAYVVEQLGPSVRVSQISLKPTDSVVVVLAGRKRHDVHFEADGSIQDLTSVPGRRDRSVPLTQVDTEAPAHALAELRARFDLGPGRVESLYFGVDSARAAHWYVNLKNGTTYFQGGAHGTGLRRLRD